MKLQRAHILNWFPIMLTVAGSLALVAGVLVAVFSVIIPGADQGSLNFPQHGAVYVGANTCYTCHSDESPNWSLTLYTQTILSPVVQPEVVTDLRSAEETQQINLSDMTDAYTTGNSASASGDPYSQHYIVKTENGHTLLTSQWDTAGPKAQSMNLDDSPVKCIVCHTTGSMQGRLITGMIDLTVATDSGMNSPGDKISSTSNTFRYPKSVSRLFAIFTRLASDKAGFEYQY